MGKSEAKLRVQDPLVKTKAGPTLISNTWSTTLMVEAPAHGESEGPLVLLLGQMIYIILTYQSFFRLLWTFPPPPAL